MDSVNGTPWRKSSYSSGSGTNCVEVATWRKATYSGSDGSNCVEAGVAEAGRVLVRDTTNRDAEHFRLRVGTVHRLAEVGRHVA
jgi:hypothetical protein